ncbi:phage head closure protein [Acinetobacter sp. 187]|uniref:phage head closure protein n=1 Tax=Acinetobacter lanii TaxID=2715163 RepID=UPI00140880BC|nr:phage head closure protein [Acinetobacter lanii]NHC02330.1 phage head closure protein [Acinetobacter lanii]
MQSGKLPHRITIEHFEEVQDQETGRITNQWTVFAKVWAKVEPLSTKDVLSAQAINSKMIERCRIRYSSKSAQITSKMRAVFRGKYRKIDGDPLPDNESGLEWLTLNLAEGESAWQTQSN